MRRRAGLAAAFAAARSTSALFAVRSAAGLVAAGSTAAALVAAGPAFAEGGQIRSGEHADFSRLVLQVDPASPWTLETGEGKVTLSFPGRRLDFRTGGIFDLIPRTRITGVTPRVDDSGTTLEIALACDCRVTTLPVAGRYLAVDVGPPDPDAPVAPQESAEMREARETAAVADAEAILLRQIERAADQGIIALADGPAGPTPPTDTRTPEPGHLDAAAEAPSGEAAPSFAAAGRASTAAPAMAPGQDPHAGVAAAPAAEPDGATQAAESPATDAAPRPGPPPPRPASTEPVASRAATEAGIAALLSGDQVSATTVYDRDRAARAAREAAAAPPPPPPDCLDDAAFDTARWSDGRPYATQAAELSRRIVGEFDQPDPELLARRVRLDLREGLGPEAELLLAAFPGVVADEALYRDIARAIDARPLPAGGPLSRETACPGAHGLWQALGGARPAWRDAAHFAGVQEALAAMPPEMRALAGPRLISRLLDEGRPEAARVVYDTVVRSAVARSGALALAEARLVAAEDSPEAALQALATLAEADPVVAAEALRRLAEIAADASLPLPDRLMTDLEAAALQARATGDDPALRALVAGAEARRGDTAAALATLRAARADLPEDPRFAPLAATVLGGAEPEALGGPGYARLVLANLDLLPGDAAGDPARAAVARRLIDLGLAPTARSVVAPALARGDADARRLTAEALLQSGDGPAALRVLEGLDDPVAVALRARAQALAGAYGAAVETLAADGQTEAAADYAWPSGDWVRVEATTDSGERRGMARFMEARRDDGAPAPAPSPDPSTLAEEDAIAEPVPVLADPSLDAARRLLATGGKVESAVRNLLAH